MDSNKEIYRQLCDVETEIPLFMQYWWMQAVCAGKEWDVLLTYDADGRVIGALPYLYSRRLGMKYVLMPQQTQIGGLWIPRRLWDDRVVVRNICNDIARQIDDLHLSYYYQQYPLASPAGEVMRVFGFKAKERVTYRIDDISNLDRVTDAFSNNKRRQIAKASDSMVDLSMSADEFYMFHTNSLAERKKKISYSHDFFMRLYAVAAERHQGQIVAVRNSDGYVQAAAFIVWDAASAYYLIPCYAPIYKDSGASARLVLECIKFVQDKTQAFDFEGSMHRGTANHYRQFGSLQTLYYGVQRVYRPIFRLALFVNRFRH